MKRFLIVIITILLFSELSAQEKKNLEFSAEVGLIKGVGAQRHDVALAALNLDFRLSNLSLVGIGAGAGVTDGTYKLIRRVAKTTGYAPLDPKAVRGMCYSGDPKITASGQQVMPDVTIAADRSIPFGTWIWIDSLGWRRVDDRGGAIKGGRLDICFATRAEALEWGVKHKTVVIVMPQQ